ncbi:hypothetical protein IMX26_08795 [Clostridium sp. 'deep sea']|uniref:hypothetical protein n=1 Tax=Clostridium sp. 'deep sea' TaxID=2779445 RepID=UPI0018964189|nr:hypothetical protein [Clostridium sp. 'deep sea']QOR36886.1 hypothetical protein IMX26_08795 [Clostridium sp. 'deep sea']
MSDINRWLNSVGKKIFVDYYYNFKQINLDKNTFAQRLLEENPNATRISGQLTRISCAQRIFRNNLQIEALLLIIDSNRLSNATINKARAILEKESLGKEGDINERLSSERVHSRISCLENPK